MSNSLLYKQISLMLKDVQSNPSAYIDADKLIAEYERQLLNIMIADFGL